MTITTNIKTALIINEPYISQILMGEKTWEMRSQRTAKREQIGLIRKGSGLIVGQATVVDCIGPLSFAELHNSSDKHGISPQQVEAGLLDKWNYAWVLENVEMFDEPLPYKHPSGAVIWVDLTKSVTKSVENVVPLQRVVSSSNQPSTPITPLATKETPIPTSKNTASARPVARDGTSFTEELSRGGWFTVGDKGNEQKFSSYEGAIAYLKAMPTAKWRRPNPQGNWGIVSGVRWE